jgi:hypothetical protein
MFRRPLPSEMTIEQLAKRERYFRAMAVTASSEETKDSLLELAERYAKLRAERDSGERRARYSYISPSAHALD